MVSFPTELMETFSSKNSAELCLRAGAVVLLRLWLSHSSPQRGARCQDLPTGKGGALGTDETEDMYVQFLIETKSVFKDTLPIPLHSKKYYSINS